MSDYEKIAESLIICSSNGECESCVVFPECNSFAYCENELMSVSSNGIKELLKEKAKLENSGKLLVAAFDLAKEKLEKYRHAAFIISETCVDESKGHISPEDAIRKIRESIYYDNTASCSDPLEEVV